MENYDSAALGLQKNLLNLRRALAQTEAAGDEQQAQVLAKLIAMMEQGLKKASKDFKPQTLQ
ncbi:MULTISPECIES: hypothetical protein [unclassified Pseudomonas]|uniref:hypothetical protein n=1 Tax=unclassified Pseudomonas TaxID=196821 RepID=UPI002097FD28|nr:MULTISPECIES: hypothetical protein [unclassified Pseudomonas]MCO7518332.1 hypothetical protein [Pseudomonas sp. 1]MCO7538780.1 hypothetical protein [Pseudomonas sp. VA159-2]